MQYILYIILSIIGVTFFIGLGFLVRLRTKKHYMVQSLMTNSGRSLNENYDSLKEIDSYVDNYIIEDKYDFD